MDIEAAGAGAGGGLVSAVLAWFGIKQRLDRNDKDIQRLQDGTVWRETCAAVHKGVDERLVRMEAKMDEIHDVLTKRKPK